MRPEIKRSHESVSPKERIKDLPDAMKYKGVDVFKVAGPFLMGTLHVYEEMMKVVAKNQR